MNHQQQQPLGPIHMPVNIPVEAYWLWLIPLFFGLVFAIRYHHEKRRLSNGIWFSLFLYSFLACAAMTILQTDYRPLVTVSTAIFALFILVVVAGFALQSVLLLWNAIIVWFKMNHTLSNMLTLILGIVLLLLPVFNGFVTPRLPPVYGHLYTLIPNLVWLYIIFWFYNYLTMLVLYQFNHPKLDQDFIIILGAGLLNGAEVSPLLARRIDKGLSFYRKQLYKTGKHATLIFSGGKGGDEQVAEGTAMLDYAVNEGLPADDGIAETESRNTYQNMIFSKKIIDESSKSQVQPKTIFVTNGYHTFRAGMFAKQAGLKADGIGAHTARFFLPNAILREYIAIFLRNKYWHALAIVGIVVFSVAWVWFEGH